MAEEPYYQMLDSDFEKFTADMSPEAARREKNIVFGEALASSEHPYVNERHPFHQQAVDRMGKILVLAVSDRENVFDVALREQAEQDAEAQVKRTAEARQIIKDLDAGGHGYGYTGENIQIDTVPGWFLESLRMQRQRHSSERQGLFNDLIRALQKYGTSGDQELIATMHQNSQNLCVGSSESPIVSLLDTAIDRVHELKTAYWSKFNGSKK